VEDGDNFEGVTLTSEGRFGFGVLSVISAVRCAASLPAADAVKCLHISTPE
jgi:hypothetical protein